MSGSGKSRVQRTLLDGIALSGKVAGAVQGMVYGVDRAIVADLSNDVDLVQADKALVRALELGEGTDRQASMLQAQRALREAMRKDFGDTTKEQLRAAIMPLMEQLENHLESQKGLLEKLDG